VLFPVTAGVTNYVRVDGRNGASGLVVLNWGLGAMPVPPPPPTTAPPVVRQGETLSLSVTTNGVPAPAIQWLKNDLPIPLAHLPVLTLVNIQAGDAGVYSAVLSNFIGAVTTRVATVVVDAALVTLARSTFDTSTEGWTVAGDAEPLDFWPGEGNPGGCLRARDAWAGAFWYWQAPVPFLGNKSAAYGGLLSVDLKQNQTSAQLDAPDVALAGGGLMLIYDFATPPGTNWTAFKVPFTEQAGWRVGTNGPSPTQAELLRVLAGLSGLWIRGEYSGAQDTGYLDNVALLAKATNQVAWLTARRQPNGSLLLEWPTVPAGFSLEAAASLPGTNWQPVAATLPPAAGVYRVTVTPAGAPQFYRLRRP
jgi:hypothetical protein